jgi:hypothetical protein
MKSKIYFFVICCFMALYMQPVQAQCDGSRYTSYVFSSYTITTVTYSTVYGQKMDIYQPVGDSLPARPLIVLAHGGSFIDGDRTDDSTIVYLCQHFAKRGYVTCSIDYRLVNPDSIVGLTPSWRDTVNIIKEVFDAISDGKAAVRYFYQDAYGANLYKIDTNKIYLGGNSAGAVLAMHYGYIISENQLPADLDSIVVGMGGLDGNSGNPGYSSSVKAIINLAGGLNVPEFITPGGLPVVSAQGDMDDVVPYTCNYPNIGITVDVRLCGLGSLQPLIDSNIAYHESIVFPGDGHVPWQNDTAKFNRVDTLVTGFLAPLACSADPTGISPVNNDAVITLFPNPASDVVNIRSSQLLNYIRVYDETGRMITEAEHINSLNYQLNTSALSKGLYLVQFTSGQNMAPVVRKVVIE